MATIETFTTDQAHPGTLSAIRSLVFDVFDDVSDEDWRHALGGWHVVAVAEAGPVSHAAVVPRSLEVAGRPLRTGYVEAVATHAPLQGRRLGSQVMTAVGAIISHNFEMGGLSTGRHSFYRRLGWESWQGPTYVREGTRLVRTPEEDDGVMVLRFGPSSDVDLTAPISCEARAGDDW